MAGELFLRGLRDSTRALVGWCVGVALYSLMLAAVFPSIRNSAELDQLVKNYPKALKSLFGLSGSVDLTSGAGYIDTELFSFMLPLFALVLAIGSGARILAGEEEAGRLELVVAYPLRRRSVVLAKGLAVAVEVAVFVAALFAALALFDPLFGLDLPFGRLAAAVVGIGLLALLHGWLALAVGALTPSRALALGIPSALAAGAYLVAGLHDLAGWLDPFRYLSSIWWIGQAPLQHEPNVWRFLVVAVAALTALAAAAVLIDRRDLKTP